MSRARDLAAFVSNADGDIKFDTDTLFIDSSANRVGIGTSAPNTKLQSKSGSAASQTTNSELISNASASFVADHANEYGAYVGYVNATQDTIGIASTRVDGSSGTLSLNPFGGKVGVGEVEPDSGFHVKGSGTNAWVTMENLDDADLLVDFKTTAGRVGYVGHIGSSDDFWVNNATTNDVVLACNGNTWVTAQYDDATLKLADGVQHASQRTSSLVSISSTFTTVLNLSSLATNTKGRGMYMISVCREGASVGSHWIGVVGISTTSASYIYHIIGNQSLSAQMSGANFQIKTSSGTENVHATVQPLTIHGAS